MDIEINLFSASEVEKLTGLTTATQRDWRRRGYLPELDGGHARYDIFDICEIAFMQKMTERGIGPQHTHPIRSWSGRRIAGNIGLHQNNYEVVSTLNVKNIMKYGKTNGIEALANILKTGTVDIVRTYPKRRNPIPNEASNAHNVISGNTFIWWADKTERWDKSYENALKELDLPPNDPKLNGPVILLDLLSVAFDLLHRSSRPFFEQV